jgi:4-hydroxybenzoyl-CoA thioesterase
VLENDYQVRIKWGDCDAAAITFYPNYFRWFDEATWQLFNRAGFTSEGLMRDHGVFIPLVDAQARFHRPGHLGDDILIHSHVAEWHDKLFAVRHTVHCGDHLVLEGTELRCWAVRHPEDARRFRALPIPPEVRAAFE